MDRRHLMSHPTSAHAPTSRMMMVGQTVRFLSGADGRGMWAVCCVWQVENPDPCGSRVPSAKALVLTLLLNSYDDDEYLDMAKVRIVIRR